MALPPNSENAQSSKSSSSSPASPGEGEAGPAGPSRPLVIHFLTLFPELFAPVLSSSLLGKAQARGLVRFEFTQIRDFTTDKHRTVDDTPFGGGEGMVMKPDVLKAAWKAALGSVARERSVTIMLTPQGKLFDQPMARELARSAGVEKIVLVCGHYEGVDERFIDQCVDREVSIGDYVLTGGELPALVIADAVTRLIPGVVGNDRSISEESLEQGLLKYPQYTRPRDFEGQAVPDVLLGGDHKAIASWRRSQMEERTRRKRPDLWRKLHGG